MQTGFREAEKKLSATSLYNFVMMLGALTAAICLLIAVITSLKPPSAIKTGRPITINPPRPRPIPRPEPMVDPRPEPTSEDLVPPPGALVLNVRLEPPRNNGQVVRISIPLPRSDIGAAARAGAPVVIEVPGNNPATTATFGLSPNSETGFTWGYAAVYGEDTTGNLFYIDRIGSSRIRTGDCEKEIASSTPFVKLIIYPLDWSGNFVQSSQNLVWVKFE